MQKNDDARPEPEVGEDGLVPIYHHESNLETRVLPKAVRGWVRQGWSTEKPAASTSSDGAAAGGGEAADKPAAADSAAPVTPSGARVKPDAAPAAKSK
jgi:hypothetical protein